MIRKEMISDFQENKGLVLKLYQEIDKANGNDINQILGKYTNEDYLFRGMHPFYELYGSDAAADEFWKPLRNSLAPIQRRQDIFIAGINDVDKNTEWVCSMGHLLSLIHI